MRKARNGVAGALFSVLAGKTWQHLYPAIMLLVISSIFAKDRSITERIKSQTFPLKIGMGVGISPQILSIRYRRIVCMTRRMRCLHSSQEELNPEHTGPLRAYPWGCLTNLIMSICETDSLDNTSGWKRHSYDLIGFYSLFLPVTFVLLHHRFLWWLRGIPFLCFMWLKFWE